MSSLKERPRTTQWSLVLMKRKTYPTKGLKGLCSTTSTPYWVVQLPTKQIKISSYFISGIRGEIMSGIWNGLATRTYGLPKRRKDLECKEWEMESSSFPSIESKTTSRGSKYASIEATSSRKESPCWLTIKVLLASIWIPLKVGFTIFDARCWIMRSKN